MEWFPQLAWGKILDSVLRNKFRVSSKNQARKASSALSFSEENHRKLSHIPNVSLSLQNNFQVSFSSFSILWDFFPWDLQLTTLPFHTSRSPLTFLTSPQPIPFLIQVSGCS